MAKIDIAKNDIVQLKDGREVRVLRVYTTDNVIHRYEAVNDGLDIPMRFVVWPTDIIKVVKKAKVGE